MSFPPPKLKKLQPGFLFTLMVCLNLLLDRYEVDDCELNQGFPLCSISINVVVLSLKALLENSECNRVDYAFIVRKC